MARNVNSSPKKQGRPSKYTDELAEKICDLIRDGFSERQIASMPGMPTTMTMRRWKDEYPDFCSLSARARQESADKYDDRRRETAEYLLSITKQSVESGMPLPKGTAEALKVVMQEDARSAALRDDSRYGDRKKVALTGADGGAIKTEGSVVVELTTKQKQLLDKVLDDEF